MLFSLRPYQNKFVGDVRNAYASGHKRVMGRMATGAGKSPTASHMLYGAHQRGKKSLFIAHRDTLIRQGAEHIKKSGIDPECIGIIKADYKPDYDRPIQVASIQSLMSMTRREVVANLNPDFIIGDEFHHLTNENQYGQCLKLFENAYVLGLTATPARFDGKGFREIMDVMVEGPSVRELIDMGFLAEYDFYSIKPLDLSEVGTARGDYKAADLERAIAQADIMGDLVSAYRKYADGLTTCAFGVNTRHVKEIVKEYQTNGIPADWIDYTMPQDVRRERLRKYIKRETLIMANVDMFSEGFDLQTYAELEGLEGDDIDIACTQLVRPTKSTVTDNQQKGRCLRIPKSCWGMPWLKRAKILDHANSLANHGLPDDPHIWTLDGVELRRQEDREQIEREEREAKARRERMEPVHDRHGELVLIDRSDLVFRLYQFRETSGDRVALAKWREFKPSLEDYAKANELFFGYKPMWAYRQWLSTGQRPMSINELKAIAKTLGFNWQWSKHEARRLFQEEGVLLEEIMQA